MSIPTRTWRLRKKLITAFFFAVLNLFATQTSMADLPKTLRTTYIEFAPVSYTDSSGRASGYLLDIMGKVLDEAGFRWTIRPYPANRMIRNMKNGSIDLWIGAKTLSELSPHVIPSANPVTQIHFYAHYIKPQPDILKPEDLKGKRVILMRGYSYNGWTRYIKAPENGIVYFESDNHAQALLALSKGRGDVLLDYQRPVAEAMRRIGLPSLHSNKVFSQDLYFLVSKKTPNAQDVAKRLDEVYMEMKKRDAFK